MMQNIFGLIWIGTSIWVLIDAKKIGVKKGQIKGLGNMGPWGWFFACFLFWFIGFPFYLIKRSKFKEVNIVPLNNTEINPFEDNSSSGFQPKYCYHCGGKIYENKEEAEHYIEKCPQCGYHQ